MDLDQLRTLRSAENDGKDKGAFNGGPALPASTVAAKNETGRILWGRISGGTVTVVKVDDVTIGGLTTNDWIRVRPGSTFAITYSSAPTLQWFEE